VGLIRTNGWSVLSMGQRSLRGVGDPRSPVPLHDEKGLVYGMHWRRDWRAVIITNAFGQDLLSFEQEEYPLTFRPWTGILTAIDQAVDVDEAVALGAYLWTFFENDRRTHT